MTSDQLGKWTGTFGDDYIERNAATKESVALALKMWSNLLLQFRGAKLDSILEVGSNVGQNLRALRLLTDAQLFAVEPNKKAVDVLVNDRVLPASCVSLADAFDIPHDDNFFDLVFTCGVLIHISSENLSAAYREIYRVSRRFILSIEYFSEQPVEIPYRGHSALLFKRDFGLLWKEMFPELAIRGSGFFWRPETGLDNLTWWLFEKI
jgi:pseudaminic acid biosynthesis-associated methylase